MTRSDPTQDSETVLLLPYAEQDGGIAERVLRKAGYSSHRCGGIVELCDRIRRGAGAALISEEHLNEEATAKLRGVLAEQPPWSDFPLLVIAARHRVHKPSAGLYDALGNVTLLDAPLRMRTLVRAVRTSIRSRQRQYAARRAIEQRDHFLAMLGHELRNPLSAISLAAELSVGDDATAASQMPLVQRQVKLLSSLIDDLLDVARVTTGKIALTRDPISLDALCERVVDGMRDRFEASGLDLRLTIGDGAAGGLTLVGDAVRLEQVLVNLLNNALKYTSSGGAVEVRVARADDRAELTVKDSGIGIHPDILPHVFEPFVQAETSLARAAGGMGVGLALVQTLVGLHGGEVGVHSDGAGRGSTFTVRLPLASAGVVAPPRPIEHARPHEGRAAAREIVVVEDNPDSRELLVGVLEREGHEVSSAPDGESGLALLLERRPHAAIVDIGLPGLDGYEVARQARAAHGAELLLIALTGYGQESDRRTALDAGFDIHLTKPPSIERLLELLAAADRAGDGDASTA